MKKTNVVIGFKARKPTLDRFETLIEGLEVEKSELAELAHDLGIERAAELIRERQMRKAQHRVAKLSAFSLQALHVLIGNTPMLVGKNPTCIPKFV